MFVKQISEAVDAQTRALPPSHKFFFFRNFDIDGHFSQNLGHKIDQKWEEKKMIPDFVAGTMMAILTVIWSHLMLDGAWYKEKLNVIGGNDSTNIICHMMCTRPKRINNINIKWIRRKTSSENWVISVTTELMETFAPFLLLFRSSRISRDLLYIDLPLIVDKYSVIDLKSQSPPAK